MNDAKTSPINNTITALGTLGAGVGQSAAVTIQSYKTWFCSDVLESSGRDFRNSGECQQHWCQKQGGRNNVANDKYCISFTWPPDGDTVQYSSTVLFTWFFISFFPSYIYILHYNTFSVLYFLSSLLSRLQLSTVLTFSCCFSISGIQFFFSEHKLFLPIVFYFNSNTYIFYYFIKIFLHF